MWLDASQSEGQAHIADIARHIVIQGFDLLHVAALALDQFSGLGPDRLVGLAPRAFQKRIPGADVIPVLKGAQLYRRCLVWIGRLLPLTARLVGAGPTVNAPVPVLRDLRVVAWPGFHLDVAGLRNI